MAEYAARTKVPAERTRIEIEGLMRKRGADQFFSGGDSERAMLTPTRTCRTCLRLRLLAKRNHT